MNRMKSVALRLALVLAAAIICCLLPVCYTRSSLAATPPPPGRKSSRQAQPTDEIDEFSPKPAPPLPAGMTGSDTKDPRYTLKAGMYNAGEAAMGMKHVFFLKKPGPFQLDATSPDDPKVDKTLAQLGIGDKSKMPKLLKPGLRSWPTPTPISHSRGATCSRGTSMASASMTLPIQRRPSS